jgi:hypothetical protein
LKKYYILLILPILIFLVIAGLVLRIELNKMHYFENVRSNIYNMIFVEPNVIDAKILYDDDEWNKSNGRYVIKIVFHDNGSLVIREVNENGAGNIIIYSVDGYLVYGMNIALGLNEWSKIIGEELVTITDIVTNYNNISDSVKKWPIAEGFTLKNIIDNSSVNNVFMIDDKTYILYRERPLGSN